MARQVTSMNTINSSVADPNVQPRSDAAFIRKALEAADPNVLRLALHQLTGDRALAEMRVEKLQIWAGALFTYALAQEHHAEVRERALEYLLASPLPTAKMTSRGQIRETMEIFGHGPLTDREFDHSYEESAWDEFPRDVVWNSRPDPQSMRRVHVLVIGAGISGLASAVLLQRLAIPYSVIERQDDLGGTWNLNTYPEVRVDSTSLIYQYKFEKKYPWKEFFASGGETKKYLHHCARKFGVMDRITFNTEVRTAIWDEAESLWQVTVRGRDGTERKLKANFIIGATGLFSTPKLPDIPGIDCFAGSIFHTTAWPMATDLTGKRVALIGTGATGVQVMPHLARTAKHLTVFQRTPSWVLSMEGYKALLPAEMQWLFEHLPFYWNWYSYGMYYLNAQLEGLQGMDPAWVASGGVINQRNDELRKGAEAFIKTKFADRPDLIEKVMPSYPPMARRPTIDNGWYDALLQENVELVTGAITRMTPTGIVDSNGQLHEVDVIVCAAGFATSSYYWPIEFHGRGGARLQGLWAEDGPRAYMGLTMPGFPNLFTPFGPNSQGRSGSFYSVAEMWARYSVKGIVHVLESGYSSMECRPDAFESYNARIDQEAKKLVWEAYGKGFYYVTKEGRSVVNSPWSGPDYRALLLTPDYTAFDLR
jgi:4-hydroxyacetophenone monooxygenase